MDIAVGTFLQVLLGVSQGNTFFEGKAFFRVQCEVMTSGGHHTYTNKALNTVKILVYCALINYYYLTKISTPVE